METINNGAFIESLKRNNRQIREDRALNISEDAELLYKRKIEDLEVYIKKLKRDQENMLDLSPESATSLKLASDFDAAQFVDKDNELAVNIREKEIRLNLAKKRYNYLFGGKYELTEIA